MIGIGSKIKIYFKDGSTIEGILSSKWNKKKIVLGNIKDNNLLIIYNPKKRISMVQVINELIIKQEQVQNKEEQLDNKEIDENKEINPAYYDNPEFLCHTK